MPLKTLTIDAKQYKAAMKHLYGTGRARDRYDQVTRYALNEAMDVVRKLSAGWQFIDGKWIEPENME